MKKFVILFTALLTLSVNASAINWSDFYIGAGGGSLLGYTFTRYTLEGGDITSTQDMDRFNFGGFVFGDFTYAELHISFQMGLNSYYENMYNDEASMLAKGSGQEMSIGFALFGKYPFKLNERFTLSPMLGIEYQVALQQLRKPDEGPYKGYVVDRTEGRLEEDMDKDGNPYPLSAWNSWNILLGAGLDFNFTENIYFRAQFHFGFRLPTGYEMGALELVEDVFKVSNISLGGINGSPTIKIAVGYRFNDIRLPFLGRREKAAEPIQFEPQQEIEEESIYQIEEIDIIEQIEELTEEIENIELTEDSEQEIDNGYSAEDLY